MSKISRHKNKNLSVSERASLNPLPPRELDTSKEETFLYVRKDSMVAYSLIEITIKDGLVLSQREVEKPNIPSIILAHFVRRCRDQKVY